MANFKEIYERLGVEAPNKGSWKRRVAVAIDPELDAADRGSWARRAAMGLGITQEDLGPGSWTTRMRRADELGLVTLETGEVIHDPGTDYDPEDPVTWDPPDAVTPPPEPPAEPPKVFPPSTETLPNGKIRKNVKWDPRPDAGAYDVRLDRDVIHDVGRDTEVQLDLDPGQGRVVEVRGRNSKGSSPFSPPMEVTSEPAAWEQPVYVQSEAPADPEPNQLWVDDDALVASAEPVDPATLSTTAPAGPTDRQLWLDQSAA